jgi:hypothetical protein
VLRGALNPSIVHVIPNAVVASHFRPAEPPPPVPEMRKGVAIRASRTSLTASNIQSRSSASPVSSIAKESIFSLLRYPRSALCIPTSGFSLVSFSSRLDARRSLTCLSLAKAETDPKSSS